LKLVRDREDKLIGEGFADAAETLTRRLRGRDAPAACIEAVRNAIVVPFEEGLKREGELFRQLVTGDQSKAQRHIFFAEREAAKVPDMPEAAKPRPVTSGAVVGAGTMGGGIAMCFANAGIPVTIVETGRDLLQKGLDRVAANYRTTVSRGGLGAGEMERRMGLITGATELEAVASADVVIEAVFEEMGVKKAGLCRSRPAGAGERRARHQYLDPRRRRNRARHGAAATGSRHALLQPGQCHAPVGGGARCGDLVRCARYRGGARPPPRQGAGHCRRLLRLCRQPDARAPVGRDRAAIARRGAAARDRRRGRRLRLPDGAVRNDGSRRARCRLADPPRAGRARPDRGCALPSRALRPEDREGVFPV